MERCYGCMKPKTGSPICPHCGYDQRTSNDTHQLPAGTVMQGKYLIGRVLGQGGFGITYLGWDMFLDIPVAIKEYYPSGVVMRDNSYSLSVSCGGGERGERFAKNRERFLREAKSLARFESTPEIVKVSNYFLENNTAYIVMEFVEGITLKQHVKNSGGKLTTQETFALLRPILRALEKVHATGLVHRDISPDNIMLLPGGGVKLIDFGAVRDVQHADADQPLTKSTEAILKQGYAPIEQYQKRGSLGPWTDVYALCATIYYCLTGTVPVDAPERVLGEEDFSWGNVPGLDAQQAAALEKGMALLPKDRIQSAKQLYEALSSPTEAPKPEPEPEPVPVKKSKGWLGAVVLAAAAFGVAAVVLTGGKTAAPEETAPLAVLETQATVETTQFTEPVPTSEPERQWEQNVLRNLEEGETLWGSDIKKNRIISVTFLDSCAGAPASSWDVSEAGDGSVLAWANGDGKQFELYFAAEGGINGVNACKGLFAEYKKLKTVNFNNAFHTEQASDFSKMFFSCESLETLDLYGIDTSNAVNMEWMFTSCQSLTELDTSQLDTAKVTTMEGMFFVCRGLEALNVSRMNTSNVTNMERMFGYCESLRNLDLRAFDTAKVTNMVHMFYHCINLEQLDTSSFDTSAVTDMTGMFRECSKLKDLDLSNFDTAKVQKYEFFMERGRTVNGKPWAYLFDKQKRK